MTANSAANDKSVISLSVRFFKYLLSVKKSAAASAVLVVLAPIAGVALLWSFKLIADEVLIGGHIELLPVFAAVYLAAAGAKIVIDYVTQWFETSTVQRIMQLLRADAYAYSISLSPGHPDNPGTGDVLTRLRGDVERTEYLIFTGPLSVLADATAALIYTGLLFYLSWPLTVCALLVLPVFVWLSWRIAPAIRQASLVAREAEGHWMTLAEERLEALPMIQAFNAQGREVRSFDHRSNRARGFEVTALMLQAKQSALIETVAALCGMGVLMLGAHQIAQGALTAGALVAFIGATGSLYAPLRALAKASGRFQHAAAGAERVARLLDTPGRVIDKPGAKALGPVKGRLAFNDVSFAYAQGTRVLDGVSLTVEPGETVALVGQSGSGKSTLIRLALRMQDPGEGSVCIDGTNIRDITLSSLRRAAVPVFQDAFVVNGTIARNIFYGAPNAPYIRMTEAARAAFADRFALASAGGYETPVGARGARLSGGQRQRVALARALLANAPILLLDEATAAVDSETEELIQDALERLAGRRTIVTVAHRLSSVRRADRVIVLENGRIVETGTPAQLLSSASRCRELFAAQLINIGQAA
ncbi:MAG: ABC transporter ATP-binding protein [Hyphomicrobium sp.]